MHVNLLRTGVGVDSVHHLHEIQSTYRKMEDDTGAFLTTRYTPTRANDLLNGGSIYWIIKQQICVRQMIEDIQTLKDEDDKKFCRIVMNPELMLVSPVPHRHIQGWRYLPQDKAPTDLRPFNPHEADQDDIDPQMAKALAEIGLL